MIRVGVWCVEGEDVDDTREYMHCALETPSTGGAEATTVRVVATKDRPLIDKEPLSDKTERGGTE